MAIETERKFLLKPGADFNKIVEGASSRYIWQYYIVAKSGLAIRLRTGGAGQETVVTIKYGANGSSTFEEEFQTTYGEYLDRFDTRVGREIVKIRYFVKHKSYTFEVDVFLLELKGLVVIELEHPDADNIIDLPDWIGREVTNEPAFKNAVLATSDSWKEKI